MPENVPAPAKRRPFVLGRHALTTEEADAWLKEFEELDQKGAYFFSSMPIITEAINLGAANRAL